MTVKISILVLLMTLASCSKKGKEDVISGTGPKEPVKETPVVVVPETPVTNTPVEVTPPVVVIPPEVTPEVPVIVNPPVITPPVEPGPKEEETSSPNQNLSTGANEILKEISESHHSVTLIKDGKVHLDQKLSEKEIDRGNSLTDLIAKELNEKFKNTLAEDVVTDFRKASELSETYCSNSSQKKMMALDGNTYDVHKNKNAYLITNVDLNETLEVSFKHFKDACNYLTLGQFGRKYISRVSSDQGNLQFPLLYSAQGGEKNRGFIQSAESVIKEAYCSIEEASHNELCGK